MPSDDHDEAPRDHVGPPLTDDELDATLAVLERVAGNYAVLRLTDAARRARLQRVCGQLARPDLKDRKRLQKELLRQEHQERVKRDEGLRKETGIQQLRERQVFAVPLLLTSGAAIDHDVEDGDQAHASGEKFAPLRGANDPFIHRPTADAFAPLRGANEPFRHRPKADENPLSASNELAHERVCYVCKTPYKRLHHFYDQLCPTCAELNFKKREPRYDLRGRIALVTGARVKIGYYAALMLLRNGCDVIVTTRFPADAAQRFAREPDADVILPRLQVWGLDLRHTPSVDALARHLLATLPRLDFIIHNACQTVRRPPGFYAHLLDAEAEATRHPPRALGAVLEPWRAFAQAQAAQRLLGVSSSAALSQVGTEADAATLPATTAALAGIFPEGALDADLQQVDLRTHNSWRATLSEVPVTELLEVLLVNAAAPFVLTSKLVPLMKRDNAGKDRHVLNVSAMEGQFYRKKKTDKHPHTNMAKAALNMLTRTSAAELEPHGIWMNAVDTGWITDEDPAHIAQMKAKEHRFSPPLDVVDGAARIVDPIFDGLQTGTHRCGVFFKDYTPAPW